MDNTYQQLLARYGITPRTGPTPTLFNNGNINPIYSFLNQAWNSYWPKQTAVSAPQVPQNQVQNQIPQHGWGAGMQNNLAFLQALQGRADNMFNSPIAPLFGYRSYQPPANQIPDILRFMKN
jgi:hypothetical protein